MNNQSAKLDVVVVGAGFSGLTVARNLKQAGVSVVVLEAEDRVGGRSKPGSIAGQVMDTGGQWVATNQTHLLALADELGVQTYPQYVEGDHILDVEGRVAKYKEGEDLPLEPADLEEFNRLMGELDALTGKIDVAAPWTVEGAAALDAQTFESWLLNSTDSKPARAVFRLIAQVVYCGEARPAVTVDPAYSGAAGGGIGHTIGSRWRRPGHPVCGRRVAVGREDGRALGDVVLVNAPVRSIAQTTDGVTVTSDAGVWSAALAVVAAAPTMAGRISYTPPMPPRRDAFTQRMPMGSIIKVHVAYETPFWRAKGLSGCILSDRTATACGTDMSYPGVEAGRIVGFFGGGHAQAWADRSPESDAPG